jgi:hypothetical protein
MHCCDIVIKYNRITTVKSAYGIDPRMNNPTCKNYHFKIFLRIETARNRGRQVMHSCDIEIKYNQIVIKANQ